MRLLILLVLAIIAVNAKSPKFNKELQQRALFDEWMATHDKHYDTADEMLLRYQNFQASILRATALQRSSETGGSSATFGLTKFSDMTPEEFRATILMKPRSPSPKPDFITPIDVQQAPQTFDWRTKNGVTAVKDQGQCGSCWAFSVTETIESAWMISHNLTSATMQTLSPQQIVDCDNSDDGCNGGNPPTAYAYVKSAGGLDTNAQYPYTAEDGSCHELKPTYATLQGFSYATSDKNEKQMISALVSKGPLSICLDAANWQDYTGGVMSAWQCAWINLLDHCVQAVGYDLSASTPYWIVRNSWGTSWGIKGYILLEYGENTCGLSNEATFVTP